MRFLVDSNLSPALAKALSEAGHDAVHTREVSLAHAKDRVIFEYASEQQRTIVSSDTDFGTLLATLGATGPSVILLRRTVYRPKQQAVLLLNRLPDLTEALEQGAIVTFDQTRVRIRQLPVARGD